MSFDRFQPAQTIKPMPNVGGLFDISAGRYYKGKHGQNLLNGGLAHFTGIVALPNMFKSTLAVKMLATVISQISKASAHAHDTETTMVQERVVSLFQHGYGDPNYDPRDDGRLVFTDTVDYDGTEYFEVLKAIARDRRKENNRLTTEFLDPKTKKPTLYFTPMIEFVDSFSGLKAENATDMLDEAKAGTKDLNMLAMRMNSGKSQMVEQLPSLTAGAGLYYIATAHVGQEYQLDPRTPLVKKLKFLKGDLKLKRVPENFSFQTGNCYIIAHLRVMQTDGLPEFPATDDAKIKGDTDLLELTILNLRGKFGPSGLPITCVVSQSEGFKDGLSEFVYLKSRDRYGLVGNDRNYALALLPDVKLSRTTIRSKLDEQYALRRAMHMTAEMCWMHDHWEEDQLPEALRTTPEELYETLKAQGYDWEILLGQSRPYWTFEELNDPMGSLTTMDLLEMRAGLYHPYWYPKSRQEMGLPAIPSREEAPVSAT